MAFCMLLNMVWARGIYSHNYCISLLSLVQGEIFNLAGNPQADRQEFISCLLVSLIISKFRENLPGLPDGLASLTILKYPLGPWGQLPCSGFARGLAKDTKYYLKGISLGSFVSL